jgi:hypothetical protein
LFENKPSGNPVTNYPETLETIWTVKNFERPRSIFFRRNFKQISISKAVKGKAHYARLSQSKNLQHNGRSAHLLNCFRLLTVFCSSFCCAKPNHRQGDKISFLKNRPKCSLTHFFVNFALAAWSSGHHARLKTRRWWVRIPVAVLDRSRRFFETISTFGLLAAWLSGICLPPRRLELWVVRSNPSRVLGGSFKKTRSTSVTIAVKELRSCPWNRRLGSNPDSTLQW